MSGDIGSASAGGSGSGGAHRSCSTGSIISGGDGGKGPCTRFQHHLELL